MDKSDGKLDAHCLRWKVVLSWFLWPTRSLRKKSIIRKWFFSVAHETGTSGDARITICPYLLTSGKQRTAFGRRSSVDLVNWWVEECCLGPPHRCMCKAQFGPFVNVTRLPVHTSALKYQRKKRRHGRQLRSICRNILHAAFDHTVIMSQIYQPIQRASRLWPFLQWCDWFESFENKSWSGQVNFRATKKKS